MKGRRGEPPGTTGDEEEERDTDVGRQMRLSFGGPLWEGVRSCADPQQGDPKKAAQRGSGLFWIPVETSQLVNES